MVHCVVTSNNSLEDIFIWQQTHYSPVVYFSGKRITMIVIK